MEIKNKMRIQLIKIREDLINLCEDNEVMIQAINEYFDLIDYKGVTKNKNEKS